MADVSELISSFCSTTSILGKPHQASSRQPMDTCAPPEKLKCSEKLQVYIDRWAHQTPQINLYMFVRKKKT